MQPLLHLIDAHSLFYASKLNATCTVVRGQARPHRRLYFAGKGGDDNVHECDVKHWHVAGANVIQVGYD